MNNFFKGKFVVITGGSSGIGLALACQLVELGASIAILARREEQLAQALVEINTHNKDSVNVTSISVDVTDPVQVMLAITKIEENYGIPDILINSAGVARPGEFIHYDLEQFRRMMEVNYFGTLFPIQSVVPGMIKRKSGHIINISSVAGFINVYGYTAYGASKYAVTGLTEALRMELAPHGIKVSVVFPSDTDTAQLVEDNLYKPEITKEIASVAQIFKPETVASEIIKGITRGRYIIIPGRINRIMYHMVNISRPLWHWYFDQLVKKSIKKSSAK